MAADALVRHVVTFGRVLREAGLQIGPGRISDALKGLDNVQLQDKDQVYWTLRTTLVSRQEEIEPFDRAFQAWFLRTPQLRGLRKAEGPERKQAGPGGQGAREQVAPKPVADEDVDKQEVGWSAHEVLRTKDFASMTPEEIAQLRRALREVAAARPLRSTRRLRRHPQGDRLDLRALVRSSLATGGEPIERTWKRRVVVPRKLVVIADVSGSMEAYTRVLFMFLQAVVGAGRGVEAFVFGTRLTRLTEELRGRDPDAAIARAAEHVFDASAGTRIGASLKQYNDLWGRRALTRGAVVVIVSDGWERDDPGLVGREMARLARQAFAVVWVNPLKGSPDYQPLAGGMRAALPYVDRFLAGHNLASLEELASVLGQIERRHAA